MTKLYYIENDYRAGGVSRCLARIDEEDFPKFKALIENLNRGFHPRKGGPNIYVYEIGEEWIKPYVHPPLKGYYGDYTNMIYLDGEAYEMRGGWRGGKNCSTVIGYSED